MNQPTEPTVHRRRRRSSSRRRINPLKILGFMSALVVAITSGLFVYSRLGSVPEVSGVWVEKPEGQVIVLDHEGDDYLLSENGKRLKVQGVAVNRREGQLILDVKTPSGLLAEWTLTSMTIDRHPALHLDQDGLRYGTLLLEHPLTAEDRLQIQHQVPDEKVKWSPSFDCATITSSVQRMLCTDPVLASVDVKLSKLLKGESNDEKEAEQEWEDEIRDACHDMGCLRDAYHGRLLALNMYRDATEIAKLEAVDDAHKQMQMPDDVSAAVPGMTNGPGASSGGDAGSSVQMNAQQMNE